MSQLRLSSAKRRIDAFLRQIDELAAASFPHDDGRQALKAIRQDLEGLRDGLKMSDATRSDVIDALCNEVSKRLIDYTQVLGLILRSTNVRNPFEVHYVLKLLIRQALGHPASLLISSEWNYTPFTYPMSIEVLPDVVMIGSPAPESGNPLILPLAGHEVGHSAWRLWGMVEEFEAQVAQAAKTELDVNRNAKEGLLERQAMLDLDISLVQDRCADHAMWQLEEVFCDLFGLILFGEGYLYAFDYLLGPGDDRRNHDYPSDQQRMHFLLECAEAIGVRKEPFDQVSWVTADIRDDDDHLFEIVDKVVEQIVPDLIKRLREELDAKGISPPISSEIESVYQSFCLGRPHDQAAALGSIISAGWRYVFAQPDHLSGEKQFEELRVLSDLILKSIEVTEYHHRVARC